MIEYIDLIKIKDIIEKNNKFIITTHSNPDGDAIGSSVGLCSYLNQIGKQARIINCDPTPSHLKFIPQENIEVYNHEIHNQIIASSDIIFILDLNTHKRLHDLGEYLLKVDNLKVVIDHHLEPQEFANYYYKDTEIASTSEIIYDLIKLFNKDYNIDTALALYTGILTDTGSFAYDRTTSITHNRVSDLINHGVEPHQIHDYIYNSKDIGNLHLYGDALKSIQLFHDDSFAIMCISQEMLLNNGKDENELEGFSVAPLRINSVNSAVTIVETKESGKFKLSFRAKKGHGIRYLATYFGGGGHELASGAKVSNTTFNELKEQILKELK